MIPALRHTTIVAVGHKARQGKDEAIKAMERLAVGGRTRRFGFSDALYAVCRVQHGMTAKDPVLLQDVGQNWRERDPLTWVRACLWSIYAWDVEATAPQVAFIGDCRHVNEADAVQALGGHVIRVRRFTNGLPFVAPDRPADHISETALDDYAWPYTLENDGTAEKLRFYARQLAVIIVPEVFAASQMSAGYRTRAVA
jgi:hypothetical protein